MPEAGKGCRVALVRPMDAMGNYPLQPKYETVWNALEETGLVYGMHPFPASGTVKPPGYTAQYSSAELIRRTISALEYCFVILGVHSHWSVSDFPCLSITMKNIPTIAAPGQSVDTSYRISVTQPQKTLYLALLPKAWDGLC